MLLLEPSVHKFPFLHPLFIPAFYLPTSRLKFSEGSPFFRNLKLNLAVTGASP